MSNESETRTVIQREDRPPVSLVSDTLTDGSEVYGLVVGDVYLACAGVEIASSLYGHIVEATL